MQRVSNNNYINEFFSIDMRIWIDLRFVYSVVSIGTSAALCAFSECSRKFMYNQFIWFFSADI